MRQNTTLLVLTTSLVLALISVTTDAAAKGRLARVRANASSWVKRIANPLKPAAAAWQRWRATRRVNRFLRQDPKGQHLLLEEVRQLKPRTTQADAHAGIGVEFAASDLKGARTRAATTLRYTLFKSLRENHGHELPARVLRDLSTSLRVGPQPARVEPGRQQLGKLMARYKASYLFIGHGSKSQYKDPAAVMRALEPTIRALNKKHGKGNWVAVFGGDNYDPKNPDVAHVRHYLRTRHKVPTFAVQSDIVDKKWGGVDSGFDYAMYVPTDMKPASGPNDKPKVLWGGVANGRLLGATKGYLGPEFIGPGKMKGVVAVGGGPIALAEAQHARKLGLPVRYIRAEARNPEANGRWGSLDSWAGGLR